AWSIRTFLMARETDNVRYGPARTERRSRCRVAHKKNKRRLPGGITDQLCKTRFSLRFPLQSPLIIDECHGAIIGSACYAPRRSEKAGALPDAAGAKRLREVVAVAYGDDPKHWS